MDKVTSKFVNSHFYDQDYRSAWTKEGYERLRTYLTNAGKGNSKIYTAPFAGDTPIEDVMSEWDNTLKSISAEWPSLYEFEKDLANKVGPLSIQKPIRDRLDDIRHYYEDILLSSKPISEQAIDATLKEFSVIRGLRVRSQKKTLDLMKKSTSSGSPWFTKKRNVLQDILPCDVLWYGGRHPGVDALIQDVPWSQPAVLGWRGQEGGMSADDVKQRVVWMFPFAVNLCELQVYQPLIEAAQKSNLVAPWVSNDAVDVNVTKLFDTKGKNDLIVCTDFSKFDQHFNEDMANCAESLLRGILTANQDSERWLDHVFPCKFFIPLAWEAGKRGDYEYVTYFQGRHGMGSGSGGTNADETLAHRALQHEVALHSDQKLNPYSMCLGDDGILTYPGITVEDVVESYQSHGQECNLSKQYASTQDCVFLRRWHHEKYRPNGTCAGVYSTMRAIGRLRYLERFMDPEFWGAEMVALRQLSIIENCKWHPLFTEFIQFCMKRDKFRLGLDIPGFMDNISKLAIEATDHMPDFLGYTKTLQGEGPDGIESWEVVKYLKSLK
nr:MAG: putative RNA-dependent RNA polymerase [Jiangsu picobirnavirus 88]